MERFNSTMEMANKLKEVSRNYPILIKRESTEHKCTKVQKL